jgi:hypothetical protein
MRYLFFCENYQLDTLVITKVIRFLYSVRSCMFIATVQARAPAFEGAGTGLAFLHARLFPLLRTAPEVWVMTSYKHVTPSGVQKRLMIGTWIASLMFCK